MLPAAIPVHGPASPELEHELTASDVVEEDVRAAEETDIAQALDDERDDHSDQIPCVFDAARLRLRFISAAAAIAILAVALMGGLSMIGLHAFIAGPIAIMVSALVGVVTMPARALTMMDDEQERLAVLADRLQAVRLFEREEPLRRIVIDSSGIAAILSRRMHDRLIEAFASRAEARRLQRTLDHTIERRTQIATAALTKQAHADPLTGLGNRRALERALERLWCDGEAAQRPVAVVLIDIDYFKMINDTLGHEVGDDCLLVLADVMRSVTRSNDVLVRLGGDEFIILLESANAEQAQGVAARLVELYAQMPWNGHAVQRPTLSIGIASVGAGEQADPDTLLRRADAALYAIKRGGRAGIATCGKSV